MTVVEQAESPATGSTGRSAAGVRVQFTTRANIGLSMYSIPVYRSFEERFGYDIGYSDIGYLLLVPEERWDAHLRSVALQQSMGAPVEVVDADEARRWVDFEAEGLGGATYGPWDGVLDPHLVTHAWVEMARNAGVTFRMRSPVTELERAGSGWRGHRGRGRRSNAAPS